MIYLILVTGQINKSELSSLPKQPRAVLTMSPAEERPLDLFSLLLSQVKLFDEATGDELAAVTAVVRPAETHTALLFDDEIAMTHAKLRVHGMDDSQWSIDSHLSHAVRFSTQFTDQQQGEVALLGARLHRLMEAESANHKTADEFTESQHAVQDTQPSVISDSRTGLDELAARIATTRRLIEIQAEFGICPCQGRP